MEPIYVNSRAYVNGPSLIPAWQAGSHERIQAACSLVLDGGVELRATFGSHPLHRVQMHPHITAGVPNGLKVS